MNPEDLARANQLYSEYQQLTQAINVLNNPTGRITMMSVQADPAPDEPMIPGVSIPAQYISFPSGQMNQIKSAITTRRDDVARQLRAMGVTV